MLSKPQLSFDFQSNPGCMSDQMLHARNYMSRNPLDDETDFTMGAEIVTAPATSAATNNGGDDEDEHLLPN